MSQITVQQLLDQVSFSLGILREAKKKFSAQLAPDFHIFDYLRDDEMGLSKCFADLLKQDGKHGQGRLFLDSFLKMVEWSSPVVDCQVQVEKQANGMDRLDIFLSFQTGLIAIENKPFAQDGERQLARYAEYLTPFSADKQWKLVYLCNDEPDEKSIPKDKRLELKSNGNFVHLTYAMVVDWLEASAAQTKALVVRVYVEQLAKFIRSKINREMDMSEAIEITKIISMSDKNIQASFDIANALGGMKKQLLIAFKAQLEHTLANESAIVIDQTAKWNEKGDAWWNVSGEATYTGFTIWLNTEKFGRVALRFSFEYKNYRRFFWGITSYALKRPTPDQIKCDAIFELLKPHFQFGEPRPNDWWTCWAWPPSDACWGGGWRSQAQPWVAIQNNTMAAEIVEFAKLIQNYLNN